MAHSKKKINVGWLKKRDGNGYMLEGGVMSMKQTNLRPFASYVIRKFCFDATCRYEKLQGEGFN